MAPPALAWLVAPCAMGVLNVTPDSFSDGGAHLAPSDALRRLAEIADQGAVICDLGAESSRPGAQEISAAQELTRLGPILDAFERQPPPVPISIDTTKAVVAARVIDAGAVLVNDISAGRADPAMLDLVAERGVGICLMHMRGAPESMQSAPRYDDVVAEVEDFLADRIEAACAAGIAPSQLLVDPGIGFGKTVAHNVALLAGLPRLARLGAPIVVGVSRKSMFDTLLGRAVEDRLAGSLAAGLAAVAGGAAVLRVHDVAATVDALRVWSAVEAAR